MSVADIIIRAGALVAAVAAILAAAWKGVGLMLRTWRQLANFLDDWNGEPARPGVPERPGVMDRLARIEEQLQPNNGTSLRDAVERIEHATGAGQPGRSPRSSGSLG